MRYDVSDRLSGRISELSWTPISPIVENFNFFISPQESKGFTHKFTGDRKIYEFKTSAYVNDEVNRFAKHCLDHTELGEDLVTDFLVPDILCRDVRSQTGSRSSGRVAGHVRAS